MRPRYAIYGNVIFCDEKIDVEFLMGVTEQTLFSHAFLLLQ